MHFFYIYYLVTSSYLLLTGFFIDICFKNLKLNVLDDNSKIIHNYKYNFNKIYNNLVNIIPLFIFIELYYMFFNGYDNIIYDLLKLFISGTISLNIYNFMHLYYNKDISILSLFKNPLKDIILYNLIPLYSIPIIFYVSPFMFKLWIIVTLLYLELKNNIYVIKYKNKEIVISQTIELYINYILINNDTITYIYKSLFKITKVDNHKCVNNKEKIFENKLSKSLNDLENIDEYSDTLNDESIENKLSKSLNDYDDIKKNICDEINNMSSKIKIN